uniref:Uncharacterized protein n=1 Tax=Pundamilia nyererei TaxID=303518 RepID=A0A3B4ET13_9CICH
MMRPKDLRQVHLARFILDALDGRIINSKTENSRTPLMHAVCLQDPGTRAKFTRLLLEKGADVNCQDEDGRTALSHACEMGHLDVVKLLVQFNADPDITDSWGNSALMYAMCITILDSIKAYSVSAAFWKPLGFVRNDHI